MKKVIILLLILSYYNAKAQVTFTPGVKTGVNIANISHSGLDSKVGFYAGLSGEIKYSKIITLQLGLDYSKQGGESTGGENPSVNLDYLSISTVVKAYIKQSGFYIAIGPSVDLDLDDTLFSIANRNGSGNDATFIDISINTGFGYEFKSGLGIDFRFKHGTLDVYDETYHSFNEQPLYRNETQFHQIFQLGLSYKFILSKK